MKIQLANVGKHLYQHANTLTRWYKMRDSAEDTEAVAKAILTLRDAGEVRAFLDDLCTPAEIRAFAERFKVARLLDEGQLSYREISERTGASTTTVTRVARFLREMPHKGYRLVLDRMKDLK